MSPDGACNLRAVYNIVLTYTFAHPQIECSGLLSTSTKPLMILDNACGGSALATFTMFDALPAEVIDETQIIAMDNSQNAVAAATHRLSESEWSDRVMTLKLDVGCELSKARVTKYDN